MAKKGDYIIENLYEPDYENFSQPETDTNYMGQNNLIPAGKMGMTLNPTVADQLGELSRNLNVGTQAAEIGAMSMQIMDTIPKQHFEEMRRKAKLAEAELTLHAPIQDMDPSGFGERGWDENKRELVERQLKDVMDKAAIIDYKGNMPVTIHGSNTAASTFKMVDGEKKTEQLVAVDRITGEIRGAKEDIRYSIGQGEEGGVLKKEYSPELQLETMNHNKWDDALTKVEFQRENAERILKQIPQELKEKVNKAIQERDESILNGKEGQEYVRTIQSASTYIQEADKAVRSEFDHAYSLAVKDKNKEQIEYLEEVSKGYAKQLGYDEKTGKYNPNSRNPEVQASAIFNLVEDLKKIEPKTITTIEEFSKDKASETFANVAMHAYNEKGEKAPIVSLENLYQGMGFSQGKDLRELVEKSQEKFIEKGIQNGMSKSRAEEMSKRLIGVTFDVGHLNMSRAHGFNEKDLVKEAEEVKKHVKHVHLTDNFGYLDTHLPIGMGNVPVQALLEALGGEGERAKKINEVGGWIQQFKTNPFKESLAGAGSQIYSTGNGPTWEQTGGFQQSYLGGYGTMLPDNNYQMFGAGFSNLPDSLGGQKQQGGGRMGGGF